MLLEKLTAIVGDANVLTGEQVRSRAVGWARSESPGILWNNGLHARLLDNSPLFAGQSAR